MHSHKQEFTLSEIAHKFTVPEESSGSPCGLKEQTVKRFIDLLFLNGAGSVCLHQANALGFSEIEVSLQSPVIV